MCVVRSLLTSPPHGKPSRCEEIQHFFATEVNSCEEANPSREGKVRLTTSLSSIYENKYIKYCEESKITPMPKNKFYAARKEHCPQVQRSREYRRSKYIFFYVCIIVVSITNITHDMHQVGGIF